MVKNSEEILKKLDQLTQAAKENYTRPLHRDLSLKWEIRDGILFLDGIWIAPASFIETERIDEYIADASVDTIEIPVTDGSLDIIIFGDPDKFGIQFVERYIKHEWRCAEQ